MLVFILKGSGYMKLMVISDIHGSLDYLNKALGIYRSEAADKLIILGDLLYHGPRNPLPKGYNPKEVSETLNKVKNEIIAIRGNCDSEVDQMVLDFPIMSDYTLVHINNRAIFLTHGHLYNEENKPLIGTEDILIHGHTHIPRAEKTEDFYILNPGSISLPKENFPNSYGILTSEGFTVKSFGSETIKEIKFN